MIRFIDLFAGIGGFRLGFESIGATCVFTSEIDKFARHTYSQNHKDNHAIAGDIGSIPAGDIPKHDLLLAGFPCQPFSKMGMDKLIKTGAGIGFDNAVQGNAFFDIIRILNHHKPAAFVLENVPNLKGFDGGKTFKMMIQLLHNSGYHVEYKVINAKPWVPQARRRIFIVGFKGNNDFYFDGFMGEGRQFTPPAGPAPILADILEPEFDIKYCLSKSRWKTIRSNYGRDSWSHYRVFKPDEVMSTLVCKYFAEPKHGLIQTAGLPRRLTPRECGRLMGFPDSFEIVSSDSQAIRQFGNAVVVPVVSAIAEFMKPYIKKAIENQHSLR